MKVQTLGEEETDPILKEAIALQGYEDLERIYRVMTEPSHPEDS